MTTAMMLFVVILLIEGFVIKHGMRLIPNKYIPIITMITSILLSFSDGADQIFAHDNYAVIGIFVQAVICATVSTGIHQFGKNSFLIFVENFSKIFREKMGIKNADEEITNIIKNSDNTDITELLKKMDALEDNFVALIKLIKKEE